MMSGSNGANVSFEEWWSDAFLQDAIEHALTQARLDGKQHDDARTIVARACRAFDDVDPSPGSRVAAWRLVARVFEASADPASAANRFSLACGVPPSETGRLVAGQQHASLDGVAAALSDGFSTGLAGVYEQANDEKRAWIDAFLSHIRSTCQALTALDRSPEAFYAPWGELELPPAPAWWEGLTAEAWAALLDDEPEIVGDIRVECSNPLLPPSRGIPLLVEEQVEISISATNTDSTPVDVSLERSPGRSANGFPLAVLVDGRADFVDDAPPVHRTPIQYKVSAENFRTASIKVVSLATLASGIFVGCRTARKVTPPKAPARRTRGANWESSITLPGPGRYELLVFLSPGSSIEGAATGVAGSEHGSDERQTLPAREVRPGLYQIEVEVDGSYQLDLPFKRTTTDGKLATETCRVFLSCDDVVEEGCNSEFERLIMVNRRQVEPSGAKPVVQLNRSARTSTLQGWLLQDENVARSYLPIVLAEDYGDHWIQPNWTDEMGRILSAGRYHKDPRPPASQFDPPAAFVEARKAIARLVRGGDDQSRLVEAAPLGEWLRQDTAFQALVEKYLDAYSVWLQGSPEVARWSDVVVVASLEPGGRTLARSPDAILLSPLHPARLAWHALAQKILDDAALSAKPCPAAGILAPGIVPDILQMPLVSPEGIELVPFLAVESNTDYWSVLWNGRRLRELADRSRAAPFGATFGITIGGISAGFSAAQVGRALDDVSNVLCAKPSLSVAISSAGGATDACNDGLVQWSSGRYAEADKSVRLANTGPRRLDVFDMRDGPSQPDDATIANLSEDTLNHVRWFSKHPEAKSIDLGIIAQLDSSEPDTAETPALSALGAGALIRHRVRRQLPSYFLSETRQSRPARPVGDPLADKVAACVTQLESSPTQPVGLRFAPNVHAIGDMLERRQADFVAVSSSAIDPACFLGGWLPESYLWDYDLPSYSQRAGDTNGYYLLSRVKPSDRDALKRALARLPGCDGLDHNQIDQILLEVARRGIPTIRGLSAEDSGATGDLGLFVAARLLQDRFRSAASTDSLVPVIGGTTSEPSIALVVPVDPFRSYLDDLARVLNRDRSEGGFSRPDLLVVSAAVGLDGVRVHLVPVEVKCRLGSVLSPNASRDALDQAKSLSGLLSELASRDDTLSVWRLSYQHLLISIIGFGMRVYSQHEDLAGSGADWSALHEQIASAILADDSCVTVDERGRLLLVDDSPMSDALDRDNDGFEETIVIAAADAGRIVAGDAQALYDSIKAKVGDWQLFPVERHMAALAIDLVPINTRGEGGPSAAMQTGHDGAYDESAGAGGGAVTSQTTDPARGLGDGSERGIHLRIGSTVDGFEKRELSLSLSDTRLNQLNMGVVGDLGTGKTQLLKSLVYQIASATDANRGVRPRMLIFDYKKDYSSPDFVAATGARVVKPQNLPLNLFDTSAIGDAISPWLDRFRFFADVLDKIYSGIGPVQRDKLKRAVRSAYESTPSSAPTIYDVHAAYASLLEGKSDSPMAIIDDLVDMEVFERDPVRCIGFDQFLQGVVVVSLDAFGQDDRSKNMLVAVMLNMFYENMLKTPKRPFLGTHPQLRVIDSYLLVDEADNIMRYEFDVLRKLLLQGREFGCGIILASQYLRHFKVNATDYREPLLTWFVHKVPNVTPSELSALGLANSAVELAEKVKALANHQCLYKSFDSPGRVVRGLPFYELTAGK
ncbi:ATP-binding protein [Paracoccus sp. WLY502]|uniref:ATP-binding protein n=1 Tax=Paracoccus yibinensis TaxID=3068891 RepID=UPI002796DE08|nr:ATP-binding protein [Paracoccus sp. WLY502]MDQ1900717.1 ATP-binding protein [Paracoccus sp. WLY502]